MATASIRSVRKGQPAARDVQHLGLRWDRFNPTQGSDKDRKDFLESFESLPAALSAYRGAFAAWEQLLEARAAVVRKWPAVGRVCFGAGDKGVLEVGIRFHRTYGVPVIPGSAQKGLVLRYAGQSAIARPDVATLLGKGGDKGWAAAVTFHDALWVPNGEKAFDIDTITVHHPDYYQDRLNAGPADWDSPTPIGTLSARGVFLFAIEGAPGTSAMAMRLLGAALRDEGIGARTLKGYGRFEVRPDQALPANITEQPLFDPAPIVPRHGAVRATPVVAGAPAPTEHVAEHAMVSYQPNTGRFEIGITHGGKPVKMLTPPSPAGLFGGDSPEAQQASMEALRTRCRKRGALQARVNYEVDGGNFTVKRIDTGA